MAYGYGFMGLWVYVPLGSVLWGMAKWFNKFMSHRLLGYVLMGYRL